MDNAWGDITDTAIIVAVPAAEPLVGGHRLVLDPAAGLGVPAHVTVLYPFVAPAALTQEVIERVRLVASQLPTVQANFSRIGWFDTQVVYLAPEPDDWFRQATAAMHDAFPQCPPYRGIHEDVIPHVTIGDGADLDEMRRAAEEVQENLALVTHPWAFSAPEA